MEKKVKLTIEEKATKFHYELNRFNNSMKLYTDSLRNVQNLKNKQMSMEDNRQSLNNEEHLKNVNLLGDYQIKENNLSKEHFKSAVASFEMMRTLLK